MKKIFNLAIIALSMGFFVSCDDELEQLPNNSLTPDTYYNTKTDFESATRGVYSAFYGGSYYGGSFLTLPDILSDNVTMAQNGRLSNRFSHEWRYNPNAAWDIMASTYVATSRANYILQNLDNLADGSDKSNFEGEARAMRALALFDLCKLYCKIPTQPGVDMNKDFGMPIVTAVDINANPLRPTLKESYDFIISELLASKTLINVDNGVGRLNSNAINALLSRVYLYMGDYAKTIEYANLVSTAVASRANYEGIWTDSNESGVIFKLDQDRQLDGISIGVDWSQSNESSVRAEYVIAFELFDQLSSNDIRKTAFAFSTVDGQGEVINAIKKMFGETGQNNGVVDAKVIRAAEVFLNKAEAYAFSGNDPEALAALNEVRSNRYGGFIPGTETGQDLLDAIKFERRVELFAEGHRFFDLKRWNEPVVRSTVYGEYFDGSGTPISSEFSTLDANSYLFTLPIPQREININPEFQQNPGYNNQ